MTEPLEGALARIWGIDGRPAGAGFLVGPRELVTAAHVLARALGQPDDLAAAPATEFQVDFPLLRPGSRLTARVEQWVPIDASGGGDIAGLRLLDPPPPESKPVPLSTRERLLDRRVTMFGFPEIAHRSTIESGVWSLGRLRGRQAMGWYQIDTEGGSVFAVRHGFSGTPVWDTEMDAVLGMVVAAHRHRDIRTGYMIPTGKLLAAWPRLRELARPPAPFPGLRPFGPEHADQFYGREELADRLVQLTRRAPVTTVAGPSGIGKSSLILAGVLPTVSADQDIVVGAFRPSDSVTPLHSLALALDRLQEPDRDPVDRLAAVSRMAVELERGMMPTIAGLVLERHRGKELLLVVDQLEEALTRDPADIAVFGTVLQHCLGLGARLRLVQTLRADFLGVALQHPTMAPLVGDRRLVTIGELGRDGMRRAITGPVERLHTVRYDAGLVERMLDDVGVRSGRLPLLQFTLRELWDRQGENGLLSHASYEKLGKVDRALTNRAELVWDSLGRAEQAAGSRLLVQLIRPAQQGAGLIKRVAGRDELDEEQWAIAQRLVASRLLIVRDLEHSADLEHGDDIGTLDAGTGVELIHEALVTGWNRLGELELADREFRTWQEALRQRMNRWRHAGRPDDRLLSGAELRDALQWAADRPKDIRQIELGYILVSRARRRKWRVRIAMVVVLALVAGGIAWNVRESAISDTAATSLADRAQQGRLGDPFRALWLSLLAYRSNDSNWNSRFQVSGEFTRHMSVDVILPNYTGMQRGLGIPRLQPVSALTRQVSADATTIATTDDSEDILLWQLSDGRPVPKRLGLRAEQLVLSRDGRYLAFVQADQVEIPQVGTNRYRPKSPCADTDGSGPCLYLYDTTTQQLRLIHHGTDSLSSIRAVSIDPTGQVLAAFINTSDDPLTYTLRLWEVSSGRPLREIRLPDWYTGIADAWLAPGGSSVMFMGATRIRPNSIQIETTMRRMVLAEGQQVPQRLTGAIGSAEQAAVSLDGNTVAVLAPVDPAPHTGAALPDPDLPHKIVAWNLETGAIIAEITDVTQPALSSLALDAKGTQVFLTRSFGDIMTSVWSLPDGIRTPTQLHTEPWAYVYPLGTGQNMPIAFPHDNELALVLPSADRPPPLQRLSTAANADTGPVSLNENLADWAAQLCRTLAGVPEPMFREEERPPGTHIGPVCGDN